MGTATIRNYRKIDDSLITGGQPTAAELAAAAAEGVRTVVNLAPTEPGRSLDDEAGLVASLGMAYVQIPVAWDNPTPQDFAAFEQVLLARPAGTMLIHCVANYRVSAFYSLFARRHLGWSAQQGAALRASIWEGGPYPVWERFIAKIEADTAAHEPSTEPAAPDQSP